MVIAITILHVIVCLILIAIVLLQTGKGASMGAAFGGASNTLFGGAGPADFLNKITTFAAIVFMITSFTLALVSNRTPTSSKVLKDTPIQQEQPVQETTPPAVATEKEAPPAATTGETSAPASGNTSSSGDISDAQKEGGATTTPE